MISNIPNKKHTLFGDNASRVSTEEMNLVFNEIKNEIGSYFLDMRLSKSLPEKVDNGDIDIIALALGNTNPTSLGDSFKSKVLAYNKNGHTNSFLYCSDAINKNVHVDLIMCTSMNLFQSRYQYYSFNDISGIIGMFAKKLNFKYGSEGFFKRFKDCSGNYHDILITNDLMIGLKILGYDTHHISLHDRYSNIKNHDDIAKFVVSSPLVDSTYFTHESLNQSDKKSMKRPMINYVVSQIRTLDVHRKIVDDDFFFKLYYPNIYQRVDEEKKIINLNTYLRSARFNGTWLMDTFNLTPGKQIGNILKIISDHFGDELNDQDESVVKDFVANYIG